MEGEPFRRAAESLMDSRRGGNGCFDRRPDVYRRPLRARLRVAQEQMAPFRGFAPALENAAVDQRPAVEIVIHVARQDEAVHERRMEEQLLKALERAEPDQ